MAFFRWRDGESSSSTSAHEQFWLALIKRVLSAAEAQLALSQDVRFTLEAAFFHDDDDPRAFRQLAKRLPHVRVVRRTVDSALDHLDEVINANMLVGTVGAYTRLAAQLSAGGVLLLADAAKPHFAEGIGPRADKRLHVLQPRGLFNETLVREGVRWVAAKQKKLLAKKEKKDALQQ